MIYIVGSYCSIFLLKSQVVSILQRLLRSAQSALQPLYWLLRSAHFLLYSVLSSLLSRINNIRCVCSVPIFITFFKLHRPYFTFLYIYVGSTKLSTQSLPHPPSQYSLANYVSKHLLGRLVSTYQIQQVSEHLRTRCSSDCVGLHSVGIVLACVCQRDHYSILNHII